MNNINLKKIYLYFFSALGLVLIIVGSIQLINTGLKTFVFTKADIYYEYPSSSMDRFGKESGPSKAELEDYQQNQLDVQRQRQLAYSVSLMLVGLPLYVYHWRKINDMKEKK